MPAVHRHDTCAPELPIGGSASTPLSPRGKKRRLEHRPPDRCNGANRGRQPRRRTSLRPMRIVVAAAVATPLTSVPIRWPSVAAGRPPLANTLRPAEARDVEPERLAKDRPFSSRASPAELNAASASAAYLRFTRPRTPQRKMRSCRSLRSQHTVALFRVRPLQRIRCIQRGTSRKTARTASASDISDRFRATSAWVEGVQLTV
jgi:hypothetical protein